MPNLPSGAGQTDSAHSVSVVMASDAAGGTGGGGTTTIDTTVLAKEAKQDTGNLTLTSIDGHVDGLEASATSIDGKLTGVATAAAQVTGNTSIGNIDTKIGAATSGDGQAAGTIGSLFSRLLTWNGASYDRVRSGITGVVSTFVGYLNTLPTAIYHLAPTARTDGQGGPLETDSSGNLRVTAAALPLATGAATGAKQDTGIASLASIDGKLTAQQGPNRGVNLWATAVTTTSGITDLSAATQLLADIAAGKEFVLTADGGDIWYQFTSATSGTVSATAANMALAGNIPDYIPAGQTTAPMTIPAGSVSIFTLASNATTLLRIRRVN